MQITHAGVLEVEAALSEPQKPTEHFPAVYNILHVGTMSGSAIQQGTQHSSQAVSFQQNQVDEVREFLNSLKRDFPQLGLAPEQNADVEADIATVEAQLRSTRPKGTIIKESLHSIRNILEGATGSLLASGILAELGRLSS